MYNSKVVREVLRTKEYSMFKTHELNRDIKPRILNKLRKSMKKIGWLKGSEILVYPNMKLIDGHHRLIVAEEMNIPIEYSIVNSHDNSLIVEHNQNKEVWSFVDNINTHAKLGNQNYILLQKFMKNFPYLRPTECIMLIKNGMNSGSREEIGSGELRIGDMKIAYEWGHRIMSLKPHFPRYYNKAIFVRAMIKIMSKKPEFIFDDFVHKLSLRPKMLKPCGTVDQYLDHIEDIYNYRRSNEDKISLRNL